MGGNSGGRYENGSGYGASQEFRGARFVLRPLLHGLGRSLQGQPDHGPLGRVERGDMEQRQYQDNSHEEDLSAQ
jgi:hypothetical protein